jgi:hypothetical protein
MISRNSIIRLYSIITRRQVDHTRQFEQVHAPAEVRNRLTQRDSHAGQGSHAAAAEEGGHSVGFIINQAIREV